MNAFKAHWGCTCPWFPGLRILPQTGISLQTASKLKQQLQIENLFHSADKFQTCAGLQKKIHPCSYFQTPRPLVSVTCNFRPPDSLLCTTKSPVTFTGFTPILRVSWDGVRTLDWYHIDNSAYKCAMFHLKCTTKISFCLFSFFYCLLGIEIL